MMDYYTLKTRVFKVLRVGILSVINGLNLTGHWLRTIKSNGPVRNIVWMLPVPGPELLVLKQYINRNNNVNA